MRRPWLLFVLTCGLAALGAGALEREELKANRRLLERWRADPEHHARLQRDLHAFYALPTSKQDQMRRLDHELNEADPSRRARLWTVLERYVAWLNRLPAEERQYLMNLTDPAQKLKAIREYRLLEAQAFLPEAVRKELGKLPTAERIEKVALARKENREQRRAWARLHRPRESPPNMQPTRLSDFPLEVKAFVEAKIVPRLSPEEAHRLRQAEGKWPELVRVVRELYDAHPPLPPLPTGAVLRWSDLPPEAQKQLRGIDKRKIAAVGELAGKWPDFALGIVRLIEEQKLVPPPLGASRLSELPPEMQKIINARFKDLTVSQKTALDSAEGTWPGYIKQLIRVARERRVQIPGLSLPGPFAVWENARAVLPDVPDRLLMEFALHDLTSEDRAQMELNSDDPMGSRDKVKKAWYRKQAELERRKR